MNLSSIVGIVLGLLGFVNKLIDFMDKQQLIASGKGLVIAQSLAQIMSKVANAKQIEEAVGKLSDDAIADELRNWSYKDTNG